MSIPKSQCANHTAERANGIDQRTLRRSLWRLATAELIERENSANGKRFSLSLSMAAASGAANPMPVTDRDLRDAALRDLALAGYRGDPVTAVTASAALARLAETDPEAGLLGRIYQVLDVRRAAYWPDGVPAAATVDLAILHAAIRASQPAACGYTDLDGNQTTRTILPLALVHPPQGVKLLA